MKKKNNLNETFEIFINDIPMEEVLKNILMWK